jgi:hypothetical protein
MRVEPLPFRLFMGALFCSLTVLTSACAGVGGSTPATPLGGATGFARAPREVAPAAGRHGTTGLGAVLTSRDGSQIFGFDINSSGNDGILATATSVESFDQDTGKITGSFPKKVPARTSYSMVGITTGDTALATEYHQDKNDPFATRTYGTIAPSTKNQFTGKWTPPLKDIQVEEEGPNQTAASTALYAIELQNNDNPDLIVSNVASNKTSKVIKLDPSLFSLGNGPQLGQDTKTNQAVFALSPDFGAVGGDPPLNVIYNMKTGKKTQFDGLNNGYFHAGSVNGLAVDSSTGIAATDTELNAQVEFYNLAKESSSFAQLPCTGDTSQLNSGSGIASDSVHGLFLVTEEFYACGSGSAILVYDEKGNLQETITGFTFVVGEGAPAINPSKRMGWVFGPKFSQLQQFFY